MASLLKLWAHAQAHLFQRTASSSSFKGQAGNLPGVVHAAQIIPLPLQLGSESSFVVALGRTLLGSILIVMLILPIEALARQC